jgi:hypothetical protein
MDKRKKSRYDSFAMFASSFRYRHLIFSAAVTLASFVFFSQPSHAAVVDGNLVKTQNNSAIYYVTHGKRYAFPNESVFFSWYQDFSNISTISKEELAALPLGGNVTYRPGSFLVKVPTSPQVYAVSKFSVLRALPNEMIAAALYGSSWSKDVRDLDETLLFNYSQGSPIVTAADYSIAQEKQIAVFADDLRPELIDDSSFAPPIQGETEILVGASTAEAVTGQDVRIFTIVSNVSAIAKIELFREAQQAPIGSCLGVTTCAITYRITEVGPTSMRFRAVATLVNGETLVSSFDHEPTLAVKSFAPEIVTTLAPKEVGAGNLVNVSSDAQGLGAIERHRLFAVILGQPNPILWKDCGASSTCVANRPVYRTTQFFAEITKDHVSFASAAVIVMVTSGSVPKPSLTLVDPVVNHQATMRLDAPSGDTIGFSSIVLGEREDDDAIALCENASCEIAVHLNAPQTFTGFTDVGGKLESSNSIALEP